METEDLSNEAYRATIEEAENISPTFALIFMALVDECKNENEFLKEALKLIKSIPDLDRSQLSYMFGGARPSPIRLFEALKKIEDNIEVVYKIQVSQRSFQNDLPPETDETETELILINNTPEEDLLGFSPNQFHELVYHTYEENSPVQFRKDISEADLDRLPLFRIAEEYLKIVDRDKKIKLTPLGALPKKIMVELYDKKLLPDEHIEMGLHKLSREHDFIALKSVRHTLEIAGLVKKTYGRLSLTKKGTTLLHGNRNSLFKAFFEAFTDKFPWSSNDGHPQVPVGNMGSAFTIFMLHQYGDTPRLSDFYASRYLKAFPDFINHFPDFYSTPEKRCSHCYAIRTFHRFLLWFGFVTTEKKGKFFSHETDTFLKTDLVEKVFSFETD